MSGVFTPCSSGSRALRFRKLRSGAGSLLVLLLGLAPVLLPGAAVQAQDVPDRSRGASQGNDASHADDRGDSERLARLHSMPVAVLPGVSSVAVNDDAMALFTNPAALNRSVPVGYYLSWERAEIGGTDQATAAVTLGRLGLGYQRVRPEREDGFGRFLVAMGGNPHKTVSFGSRNTWQRQSRRGPDESTWRLDLGLLWRPKPFVSLGAVAADLNQGRFFDRLYRRSYTVGLGVRPLPADHFSRLTLFADLSGSERAVWKDDAVLQAGVQVEPIRGLEVSGSVGGPAGRLADERTYRVGLGLHGLHSSALAGIQTQRDAAGEDQHSRTVYAIQGTSARQRAVKSQPVVATLTLEGTYADEAQNGLALPVPFLGSPSFSSVRSVLKQLERAEKDPHVKGVLIDLGPVSMGGLTSEVRDAIGRVRFEGKPVVAYMEECMGVSQYSLAAHCDRIVLEPMGGIAALGFRADVLYFGEMLDSTGIQFEKVEHGKFKSAGEQLVRSRPSEGFTEAMNAIIDDTRETFLSGVCADRKLDRARFEELANGQIIEPDRALAEGLIDSIGDRKVAERIVSRLAARKGPLPGPGESAAGEADAKGKLKTASTSRWTYRDYAWATGPKVAVLWLDGTIETGKSRRGFFSGNTMGSETVVAQLEALGRRKDVKAIVLRIDSGGGSAQASDQMWRAVEEVQKKGKKVVASMSRVAASGGYYIACGADEIFADPATITGSIGVLSLKPNVAEFYDRHGLYPATFERGRMMGMHSGTAPLTPEQRQHMQSLVDLVYDRFLDRVAAGRPLTKAQIDSVGQGRIWTGRQALDRKLVDHLGGLEEAVARARELADVPADARVENVTRPGGSIFERLLTGSQVLLRGSAAAENAALRTMLPGIMAATQADSPVDLWLLRKWMAAMESRGVAPGLLLENPLAGELIESF